MKLAPDETIAAVVPEYCRGPGWANKPIWVHIVSHQRKSHRVECIQPEEQTAVMHALFRTLDAAHSQMLHEVMSMLR